MARFDLSLQSPADVPTPSAGRVKWGVDPADNEFYLKYDTGAVVKPGTGGTAALGQAMPMAPGVTSGDVGKLAMFDTAEKAVKPYAWTAVPVRPSILQSDLEIGVWEGPQTAAPTTFSLIVPNAQAQDYWEIRVDGNIALRVLPGMPFPMNFPADSTVEKGATLTDTVNNLTGYFGTYLLEMFVCTATEDGTDIIIEGAAASAQYNGLAIELFFGDELGGTDIKVTVDTADGTPVYDTGLTTRLAIFNAFSFSDVYDLATYEVQPGDGDAEVAAGLIAAWGTSPLSTMAWKVVANGPTGIDVSLPWYWRWMFITENFGYVANLYDTNGDNYASSDEFDGGATPSVPVTAEDDTVSAGGVYERLPSYVRLYIGSTETTYDIVADDQVPANVDVDLAIAAIAAWIDANVPDFTGIPGSGTLSISRTDGNENEQLVNSYAAYYYDDGTGSNIMIPVGPIYFLAGHPGFNAPLHAVLGTITAVNTDTSIVYVNTAPVQSMVVYGPGGPANPIWDVSQVMEYLLPRDGGTRVTPLSAYPSLPDYIDAESSIDGQQYIAVRFAYASVGQAMYTADQGQDVHFKFAGPMLLN